jgi:hypothetical protein
MPVDIYLLTAPGYWYVGSTQTGLARRFQRHLHGQGGAPLVKERVQELGRGVWQIALLEGAVPDRLEAERRWYDYHLATQPGQTLNFHRPGAYPSQSLIGNTRASGGKGRIFSSEHRQRLSMAATARAYPDECVNGHAFEENTYIRPNGRRQCRVCRNDASQRWYEKKRAA